MAPPDPSDRLARADAAGPWRPESFRERGVSLPFTTPFLLGGRARPAERGGAELVLDHPARAGCVRVLPWSAVPNLCAPTLHDRALWERAAALPELSPAAVREAARAVAMEGFAGRGAARAAAAAEAERRKALAALQYNLLLELLRRAAPATAAEAPAERRDDFADVERRAASALNRLRAEGGPPPAAAMAALGEIASASEGFGPGGAAAGRLPLLADGVSAMAEEIAVAASGAPGERRAGLEAFAESAVLALRCARAALDGARALLDDPWGLLRRWPDGAAGALNRLNRPEWALDGWGALLAAWRGAGPEAEGRAAATLGLAPLVPPLPAEADAWTGPGAAARSGALREALWRWGRAAPSGGPPIARGTADPTARNEALRAACP